MGVHIYLRQRGHEVSTFTINNVMLLLLIGGGWGYRKIVWKENEESVWNWLKTPLSAV